MRVDAKIERRGRWTRSVTVYEHRDPGEAYKSDWPAAEFPVKSEAGYALAWGEKRARSKAQRMIRKQERKIECRQSAITIGSAGHVAIHQPSRPTERLVFPWG